MYQCSLQAWRAVSLLLLAPVDTKNLSKDTSNADYSAGARFPSSLDDATLLATNDAQVPFLSSWPFLLSHSALYMHGFVPWLVHFPIAG